MLPDLAKQYSLLRSGGNCHTEPDVGEPAPTSSWREAVQAEILIKSTVQSTISPSNECATIQAALLDAWGHYSGTQADKEGLTALSERLAAEINTLSRLSIKAGVATRDLHSNLLPFFRAARAAPLPVTQPQGWMLRRFLPPSSDFTPYLYSVRVLPQPEFDAMYRTATKLLKLIAVSVLPNGATKEPEVNEAHYRMASAHPSLLASIDAVMGSEAYTEAKTLTRRQIADKREAIESSNQQILEQGLPLSYIPNVHQREEKVTSAQKKLYAARNDLLREVALTDAVGIYKELSIHSETSRHQLLAGLASPSASALVAIIRNVLAAIAGRPLPHAAPREMFPAGDTRPPKVIVYCSLYATLAFVTHVVRTCGPWKYRHVIKGTDCLDEWREDPDVPLLLVTAKDTKGLELQRASSLIFFEVPTRAAVQAQAIGRVVRKGQTVDPYIYRIEAAGTYSDRALTLAQSKAAIVAAVDVDGRAALPLELLLQPETLELLQSEAFGRAVPKRCISKLTQKYIDKRIQRLVEDRDQEQREARDARREDRRQEFEDARTAFDYAKAALTRAEKRELEAVKEVEAKLRAQRSAVSSYARNAMNDAVQGVLRATQAKDAAKVARATAVKAVETAEAKLASARRAHERDATADAAEETEVVYPLDQRYGQLFRLPVVPEAAGSVAQTSAP
ncbi:unnamed protein product [Parajaminaea phylloscopi]